MGTETNNSKEQHIPIEKKEERKIWVRDFLKKRFYRKPIKRKWGFEGKNTSLFPMPQEGRERQKKIKGKAIQSRSVRTNLHIWSAIVLGTPEMTAKKKASGDRNKGRRGKKKVRLINLYKTAPLFSREKDSSKKKGKRGARKEGRQRKLKGGCGGVRCLRLSCRLLVKRKEGGSKGGKIRVNERQRVHQIWGGWGAA